MVITLTATAREGGKNLTKLRSEGLVPAVVYGTGREALSVSVPMKDFQKVLKEAGESGSISLKLDSGSVDVLVHQLTNDPIRGIPTHVDFLAIDVNKPIEVNVPLEFVGVAPAVKGGLGVLVKVMHELYVKGLSKNLPHSIEVDISSLDSLDSQIAVSELKLPSGVESLVKAEDIVVAITSIKEEVEEPAAPIDFSAIEVEKKGKKEEEGETEAK